MQTLIKRILFIGLGGAGQRHLRLFRRNLIDENVEFIAYRSTNKTPLLNSDFSVNQKESLENAYDIRVYDNLDDTLDLNPDLAVISTPSSTHLKYARLCVERGINVLVEKPLSDSTAGLQEFKELAKKNSVSVYVGLQRRFHPHLSRSNNISKSGEIGRVLTVSFTVASYVPRWHPYENYLELYACRKELGGGVLLTEIHEIDLAIWYFGIPNSVVCIGGTYSDVGIDVEDTVRLTLDYVKFSVQINLTFWQRHQERFLSVCGEDGYLSWSQDDDILMEEYFSEPSKNSTKRNPNTESDAMFDAQVRSIIDNLNYPTKTTNIDHSIAALKIVEAAKKSMNESKVVEL